MRVISFDPSVNNEAKRNTRTNKTIPRTSWTVWLQYAVLTPSGSRSPHRSRAGVCGLTPVNTAYKCFMSLWCLWYCSRSEEEWWGCGLLTEVWLLYLLTARRDFSIRREHTVSDKRNIRMIEWSYSDVHTLHALLLKRKLHRVASEKLLVWWLTSSSSQQGRGPSHSFLLLFFWKPVFSISALKHHEFYNCDEKLAELRAWPWSAGKKEVSTQFHFLFFYFYFWWLFKERKKKPSQLMVREERRFSCCHQSRWCHSTSQRHHLLF